MRHYCHPGSTTKAILAAIVVSLVLLVTSADRASAQTRYSYIPSASPIDYRFVSITGDSIQTLGDQMLQFKITSPAASANFQFSVFDGETGGKWDVGTQPLEYVLCADPAGDATGTTQVSTWSGSSMPDNAWFNATVTNVASAKGASGDYFYVLRVRAVSYAQKFWSNFKLRVTGTISALRLTNIAYTAPLNSMGDAQQIYPNYPDMTTTVYDGVWDFVMLVPTPQTSLEIWDGDLDRGSYDCSDNDDDDPDTQNSIPPFATGAAVRAEGIAQGGLACQDAAGNATTGTTTSNPADDSRNAVYRRGPGISYTVIDPNGRQYQNNNPSGNLEWERFRIDRAAFNRANMDYHADTLPAGIYHIRISGVDLTNLNAIRVPFDILGVDTNNMPPQIPTPYFINGTVWNDGNQNGRMDLGEIGVEGAVVTLSTGATVTTGASGTYSFTGLQPQTYTVRVTMPSGGLSDDDGDDNDDNDHSGRHHHGSCGGSYGGHDNDDGDDDDDACTWGPTFDFDGIATPNQATVTLSTTRQSAVMPFGYACVSDDEDDNDDHHNCDRDDRDHHRNDCRDNHSLSYWASHTNNWSCNSMTLGHRTYCKNDLVKIISRACNSRDKSYTIAAELIAAKLNRTRCDWSSDTRNCIKNADNWLCSHPVGCNVRDERNSSWTDGRRHCDRLKKRNGCDDDGHIG